MGKKQIIIILIAATVFVVGVIAAAVLAIPLIFLPKQLASQGPVIFHVERGQSLKEISQNLENSGVISWGPAFGIYAVISGSAQRIQAGTYLFSSPENVPQIMKDFVQGKTADVKITIPEGFTADDIYEKLKDVTSVTREELAASEGYLFPDTYEISYGASSEDVVGMMKDNFDKKVGSELLDEIARQGKTLGEIVTMASLLEKEVKTKEEKEIVSGILWKRMDAGMLLQVDSAPETYEKKGLPQTPICNPGLESILAAIYPSTSPYWYYLTKPDGTTIFSKTLAEQNAARAKYLK